MPFTPSGGGRSAAFWPVPLSSPAHPPRRTRSVGVLGKTRAPGAVRCRRASLAGGGWGGRPVSRPPVGLAGGPGGRGVAPPQPVPLPSLGRQQCGRHRRRSGHGGRGPHTAPVCRRVPLPGVISVSLFCAGVGSPACRDPRGSRSRGLRGRAACGSSCAPPGRRGPSWGRRDTPSASGGVGGPAPPRPAGRRREWWGRAGGGAAVPCPPAPGGWSMALVPVPLGTPPGYTRSAGVAGQPWALGAA